MKLMLHPILLAIILTALQSDLSEDQQLVVACHRLEVDSVTRLIRTGANVNARFGRGHSSLFKDKWTFGTPMATAKWTPLIALANAHRYPDPPRVIENTQEDRERAIAELRAIPQSDFEARESRRLTILHILLSHGCDVDAHDGYGATALYAGIYNGHQSFVLTLLDYSPNVNTKTGIYIDGTGDTTPLHRAASYPEITKKLLELGADVTAKDTTGQTPFEWAKRYNSESAAMYKSR